MLTPSGSSEALSGAADPFSSRRLRAVVAGGVLQPAGFFLVTTALTPDGAATPGTVVWWALAASAWFATVGVALALSLRLDPRRMQAVVGSSFGLVVPGFIGWIAVGILWFANVPLWRALITLTGALIGAAFWSVALSYAGGRLAERVLRLTSDERGLTS